jgi:hypothetical protein
MEKEKQPEIDLEISGCFLSVIDIDYAEHFAD